MQATTWSGLASLRVTLRWVYNSSVCIARKTTARWCHVCMCSQTVREKVGRRALHGAKRFSRAYLKKRSTRQLLFEYPLMIVTYVNVRMLTRQQCYMRSMHKALSVCTARSNKSKIHQGRNRRISNLLAGWGLSRYIDACTHANLGHA